MLLLCGVCRSQTEAPPQKFEVASIKPSRADAPGVPFDLSPSGSLNINTSVKPLILMAYQLQEYRLAGDPKWLETEYYRIVAKPPAGPILDGQKKQNDATSERLRHLLAERFQLAVHHETRNLKEYVLVVAKGGPRMKEVEHDAAAFKLITGKGRIATRGGARVAMLANFLGNLLHYPVIDKTGLGGYYDIQVNYFPDDQPDAGPSLVTALQEQLGLRLQADKGPVDVLVIDRVERPTEN